jgi:hypothetical protein
MRRTLAAVLLGVAMMAAARVPTKWASPVQREAFNYGPMPLCLSGGFGAGKTWAACLKGVYLSTQYAKNRGVVIRRVGKELRATTMATWYKVCGRELYDRGARSDQEGRLMLNNGSEVLFIHLEDPAIQAILRGLEINWFLIDQAEEAPETMEENFDILMGRLSRWDQAEVPAMLLEACRRSGREWTWCNPETGKPMPPPYPMVTCNPDIELHWLYRRFHPESQERLLPKLPELDVKTGQPTGRLLSYANLGYKMFEMPSLDNRFLSLDNKSKLLAHDEAYLRRYVFAKWGVPEGAIHVINNASLIPGSPEFIDFLRQTCTLYRTLDHGDTAPTCCLWWAVDRNGNVICFREYYMPNALVSTHRQNIAELSVNERYEDNLSDPSIFTKLPQKKGGRWSTADEYMDVTEYPRETAIFWRPGDNNELGTRNRINEYLRVDPERINPFTKSHGSPRLFFVQASESWPQGCHNVLRETRSQRRVKIGTDLGRPIFSDERDPDVVDHAYDALRYFLASRAPAPAALPANDEGTFFAAQRRLARWNREHVEAM